MLMDETCDHPFRWRGDRADEACAILICARPATTQVTWWADAVGAKALRARSHDHAIWYCEDDAQLALQRAQRRGTNASITARVEAPVET